jgi:hypothetical protein
MAGLLSLLVTLVSATSASAAPPRSAQSTPIGELVATLQDPKASASDFFGARVEVSGAIAVVGSPGDSDLSGAAYTYVKSAGGWPTTPTITLSDPGVTAGDQFGRSVAVSGTRIVVGGVDPSGATGMAYIYMKGPSRWPTTPTTTISDCAPFAFTPAASRIS